MICKYVTVTTYLLSTMLSMLRCQYLGGRLYYGTTSEAIIHLKRHQQYQYILKIRSFENYRPHHLTPEAHFAVSS